MDALNLPMASESWLFLGYGAALLYLKLNPAPIRNRTAFFLSWCAFFATLFLVLLFGIFRAWNNPSPLLQTAQTYRLVEIWAQAISWTVVAGGVLALYQALTPATGMPEKPAKGGDSERRGRRGRSDSQMRDAITEDSEEPDYRSRTRTPATGVKSSNRFGINGTGDLPDPVLEARVEDELDSEPELVLSKDDELADEPELNAPLPKVTTTSASISRSRNAAVDRPKTERIRPRSEINPAVKRSGTAIPVSGSGGGTAGSRTGIPVTSGDPTSMPAVRPASQSGRRPAASGLRLAAQSGALPALPEGESADTPSKDQYLDK